MKPRIVFILAIQLALAASSVAQSFAVPEGMSPTDRARFERFESFQIRGVCGDRDLDGLASGGVNTVRGYTIGDPGVMRAKLDDARRLGMKMIVSEWMPHHGENKDKKGHKWTFDYTAKGDEMVAKWIAKIEAIGDHPAILMWGLGNEVHLDEPYLRVVNRMSKEIHKRFPHHLTSLTMVNAKPEAIAAVKKFAPDLDVLGVQSYSRGAVRGAIKSTETHWGKPFYVSEFNANGPWNYAKTPWGVPVDEPVTRKVSDLLDCYAAIDASPLCLGSTIFVWGHYAADDRPTYFSLLLAPHPEGLKTGQTFADLLRTPQADAMIEHFTKQPIAGNRAPVLSKLEFADGAKSKLVQPGEPMTVHYAADDTNGDAVEFTGWILQSKARGTTAVAGPFARGGAEEAVIHAPEAPGDYYLMIYALDQKGGASSSTLAFKVTARSEIVALSTPARP